MNTIDALRSLVADSLTKLGVDAAKYISNVRATQELKFGDYQINCAMPLAKELSAKPRDIAQKIVEGLPPNDMVELPLEVAGPGFVNVRLRRSFLASRLTELWSDPNDGITPVSDPKGMIVDYSSPNVAKPMHVGHLRSTILGDAITRMYRALGWSVVADNHLGDWGTQFGMLIHGWRHCRDAAFEPKDSVDELAYLYKKVNLAASRDDAIASACREETAKLHEGDADNLALWKRFMPWCIADLEKIYEQLDIHFDHHHGESFYQPMLANVVEGLKGRAIAKESDGAVCVFYPTGRVDEEGEPVYELPPTIIQKADGAFTYATSDLACIQYRVENLHPDVIVYVVDERQSLHFQQLFAAARKWGYDSVELVHISFGSVMGKDGKPFKTREGGTVGLETLLDEAVERARRVVDENSPELPEDERASIAEIVGIGAVKYADLSQNRTSNYVFDWDKMISLQGNTATYLQYVYARNRSIFRKGGADADALDPSRTPISLEHPSERALAKSLLQFGESVEQAALDYKPNVLTSYLFDLANAYNGFFRDCPVLKAQTEELRASRLILCELTARTIRRGLGLLGIQVVERM